MFCITLVLNRFIDIPLEGINALIKLINPVQAKYFLTSKINKNSQETLHLKPGLTLFKPIMM